MEEKDRRNDVLGELVVLGYNGMSTLWGENKNVKPACRYLLKRREYANGVVKACSEVVEAAKQSAAVQDNSKHVISYTLSKNRSEVVEYADDPNTDMFQIGRSSEPQIDFTVVDTWLGLAKHPDEMNNCKLQSTISRYSCRILVGRGEPHDARLYAAGFDSYKNIFLGEKATKWRCSDGSMDALTTNGVLILHPHIDDESSSSSYVWRECSVNGHIYSLRESRSASQKGEHMSAETNMLTDGSLIDLCGATLLYRTKDGLQNAPSRKQLESRIDELNAGRPQCPVSLNTLVIPRGRAPRIHDALLSSPERLPCVYLNCGHVQGQHSWGHKTQSHECPLCYTESEAVIQLSMGMESAFHLDAEKPDYAFVPCGHMASRRTVRYWSRIPMPQGSTSFATVCPFCTTNLDLAKPYVKLIFQDYCDSGHTVLSP